MEPCSPDLGKATWILLSHDIQPLTGLYHYSPVTGLLPLTDEGAYHLPSVTAGQNFRPNEVSRQQVLPAMHPR